MQRRVLDLDGMFENEIEHCCTCALSRTVEAKSKHATSFLIFDKLLLSIEEIEELRSHDK